MNKIGLKYVIIGGSAGSFQPILRILSSLPKDYPFPVFLCLHRLKHVKKGFVEALALKTNMKIIEPNDKDFIKKEHVYLAPANYHMYFESNNCIALSTDAPVNHSRPSIDISFESAAYNFKSKLIGVILSGANTDGACGLKQVKENGGITIVQKPAECQIDIMTKAAIESTKVDYILTTEEIIEYLLKIAKK